MDAQVTWQILGKAMFIRSIKWRILLVAALAIPFTLARAGNNHGSPPLKASRTIGMDVENLDGQTLGKLKDFVFDVQTRRLKYVLLTSGGFLGIRAKLRAVPPQLFSAATAKRGIIALSVPEDRWQNAPTIKSGQLASLAEPVREREIMRYYERFTSDTRVAKTADHNGTREALTPTGRGTAQRRYANSGTQSVKLASELIGTDVYDQRQEKLGEVMDVLVDFSQQTPVFVVFSVGKLFKDREHDYAAPLRYFCFTGGKITVEAEGRNLIQAQPFNIPALENATTNSAASVYRYSHGDSSSTTDLGIGRDARAI